MATLIRIIQSHSRTFLSLSHFSSLFSRRLTKKAALGEQLPFLRPTDRPTADDDDDDDAETETEAAAAMTVQSGER